MLVRRHNSSLFSRNVSEVLVFTVTAGSGDEGLDTGACFRAVGRSVHCADIDGDVARKARFMAGDAARSMPGRTTVVPYVAQAKRLCFAKPRMDAHQRGKGDRGAGRAITMLTNFVDRPTAQLSLYAT